MRKFRIKRSSVDYQVGNFVYHEEADVVKVSDVSGFGSHRVSKMIAKGRQLSLFLEQARKGNEDAAKALHMYAVTMFNVLSTVFDADFLLKLNEEGTACMERHKDVYGMKDDVTEESEREDLEAVRDNEALEQELREKAEEGE